jgi:hypothetical protein
VRGLSSIKYMNRRLKKSATDSRSVDIDDDYALEFWAQEFCVTQIRLKAAVLAVGTGVPEVKRELARPKTA